jgi:nucleotide-binding universal stress UspA family protein
MFRKLLVPLDRSMVAEQALLPAASIARALDADIDLMMVVEPHLFGGGSASHRQEEVDNNERYLEQMTRALVASGPVTTSHAVLHGRIVDSVLSRARAVDADLIVMTSHGRTGLSRAWMGSIADGLVHQSPIPVLMLHATESGGPQRPIAQLVQRILLPLDGATPAAEVLQSAAALALTAGGHIMLLRVVHPVPQSGFYAGAPLAIPTSANPFVVPSQVIDRTATDRARDEAKEQLGEVAQQLVALGIPDPEMRVVVAQNAAQAIVDFVTSHEISMVAMSTHGRGSSRLVVGSVADKVLRASGLPMLLHRPTGRRPERGMVYGATLAPSMPAVANIN